MSDTNERVRIWDAPVRLFHWLLVILIAALWWTGTERMLDWHRLAGYSIFALVLFRILWGLFGSSTARFSHFVRGPSAVGSYVRNDLFRRGGAPHVGHNPLGGWSVIAMLIVLLVQTMLGMVAVDIDGIESGPFSYLVDFETGRLAARLHHQLFNVLLALIALHVLAILYYLLHRRQNLVGPMITGSRRLNGEAPAIRFAPTGLAILLLLLCAGLIWAAVAIYGQA